MSFCANPPRRVFFCCTVEPADGGGETPLCDFRAVWRDLDPDVRRTRYQELSEARNATLTGILGEEAFEQVQQRIQRRDDGRRRGNTRRGGNNRQRGGDR